MEKRRSVGVLSEALLGSDSQQQRKVNAEMRAAVAELRAASEAEETARKRRQWRIAGWIVGAIVALACLAFAIGR